MRTDHVKYKGEEWDYDGIYRRRRKWPDDEVIDARPSASGVYAPVTKPKWTLWKAYLRQMRNPRNPLLLKAILTLLIATWTLFFYAALAFVVCLATFTMLSLIEH